MDCFGETVVARFALANSGTTIEISSKPRIYGTEMDMGKGVENVEVVVQYLLERGGTRRVA